MEAEAEEWNQRAIELMAWACLNTTALHQRNAATLCRQWESGGRKMENMEGNDIPKLIQKTGGFDTTNADSKYNLDHMVQMQDEAAVRDVRRNKTCHHQYGGILGPLWRDEGELEEFNESLPRIRQEQNHDSDDYYEAFNSSFKIAYPLPNLGRVLGHMGHNVSRERLAWPQQIRDRLGRKTRDQVFTKRGHLDPEDESQLGSIAPSEYGNDDQGMFAVPKG